MKVKYSFDTKFLKGDNFVQRFLPYFPIIALNKIIDELIDGNYKVTITFKKI